ncbi:MAG: UDPGP type 1 family protein [Planctomycetes bacterium]|nr:UDPGP type 1 family protein [Planctomycetota bacterium]
MPQAPDHATLLAQVTAVGQQHVFAFYHQLNTPQQAELDRQVAALDWTLVAELIRTVVLHPQPFKLPDHIEPAPYFLHTPRDATMREKYRLARTRGEELLRKNKIAAFVVAGGQGSRLGWNGPKGTFPATAVKNKPLFQCFAEYLRAMELRFKAVIPFYIMTSTANHRATVDFWAKSNFFGLPSDQIMFFPQGMLPAVSLDGKVLLETPGTLALSPNGHGGSLLALHKSGALADMQRRGITHISYFQVDNPIVRCVDPLFIGLHDMEQADMSSKILPKLSSQEKLGNMCLVDGKMTVIEYSDFPDTLAEQRTADGALRFRAGSIALHAIRCEFVQRLNARGFALPYHRAEKKVPCVDIVTGKIWKPEKSNAIKMETFVFDALPLADRSMVYETDRLDEFAPIKNAEGVDSIASSRQITTLRNSRWLEAAGVKVPRQPDGAPDCTIEIAASFALYPEDIKARRVHLPTIKHGDQVYLE